MNKLLSVVASLALFAASAVHAQETLPVQGTGATGAPGDQVFVELDFDYGAGFEVTTEDFQMRYDASVLNFRPDLSTVFRDGVSQSLPNYLSFLAGVARDGFGSSLSNNGVGFFNLSFTSAFAGDVRSGHVIRSLAFDIAPAAAEGRYLVSFGDKNVLTDVDFNEFEYEHALQVTVQAAVVPEPEMALMLLPGLALIGWQVRRRRARQNHSA
jgi:hypothetical protein